jgi:replicative DNA helicase
VDKTTIISLEREITPQVLDLEEAVLGAMMIDKKGVDDVIDIYNLMLLQRRTQTYFEAIVQLLPRRNH